MTFPSEPNLVPYKLALSLIFTLICIIFVLVIDQATYYPGLCEPTSQGGLGFDYYVNLSAPEMWSTFLETVPDHEWSMTKVVLEYSR